MTPQYYIWTEARPFVKANGLGSYDTILHISKEEPGADVTDSHFCILTNLEDPVTDARTLNVPYHAMEFISEVIDKVDISSVAVPDNLESLATAGDGIIIPDYHGKYFYEIDTERIKNLYKSVDVLLYMVDIIYTMVDDEPITDALSSPDDDAVINTWLNEYYVKSYELAGLVDLNHTILGYQGPVIMGKMPGKVLDAIHSLNNKIL